MNRIVSKQEALDILNGVIKQLKSKGEQFCITYEKSTSYSRGGRYDCSSLETAFDIAKDFVIQSNHRGVSGRVLITIYRIERWGCMSQHTISIKSPFIGERNELGYALPDKNRLDEVDYINWE